MRSELGVATSLPSAEAARRLVPMNKSGHQKCPFKSITIEGVTQKVTSNVVFLKGTPSGWGGSFRWEGERQDAGTVRGAYHEPAASRTSRFAFVIVDQEIYVSRRSCA